MAVFFAANALWWAYRAGATIARGYLDWEAGRRGTTLEAAFKNAKLKRQFGQISEGQMDLVNFVMFNDRWRWTDPKDFALDTSAVLTSGLGLLAKVGLGNRILAVLGVKSAPTAGVVIDGVIDAVGSLITGGAARLPGVGDLAQAVLEVLSGVRQTDAVVHGTNVVNATVKLGSLIQPFLGAPSIPKAIMSIPAIIDATAQLFGSILGFWGVVEAALPGRPPPRNLSSPAGTSCERSGTPAPLAPRDRASSGSHRRQTRWTSSSRGRRRAPGRIGRASNADPGTLL